LRLSANAFETTSPPLGLGGTGRRCSVLFLELYTGAALALAALSAVAGVGVVTGVLIGLAVDCGVIAEGDDDIADEVPPHPDRVIAVGTAITVMSFVKFMC